MLSGVSGCIWYSVPTQIAKPKRFCSVSISVGLRREQIAHKSSPLVIFMRILVKDPVRLSSKSLPQTWLSPVFAWLLKRFMIDKQPKGTANAVNDIHHPMLIFMTQTNTGYSQRRVRQRLKATSKFSWPTTFQFLTPNFDT